MSTDPNKPAADDGAGITPPEAETPVEADEGAKNIEEEGEPFDGNFA